MYTIIGYGPNNMESVLVYANTKKDAEDYLIAAGINPKTGLVDPNRDPNIDDDYEYKECEEADYLTHLHWYFEDNPTIAQRFVTRYNSSYEISSVSIKELAPHSPLGSSLLAPLVPWGVN